MARRTYPSDDICLVSEGLRGLRAFDGLARALGSCDIALRARGAGAAAGLAIEGESRAAAARWPGLPILTVGESVVPGHLRLGEVLPGAGEDRRLARLIDGPAAGIDEAAVAAALARIADRSALPAAVTAAARGRDRDTVRRALAAEVLFNAASGPEGLAALIAEAVEAVGFRPRRSVSIVVSSHNYLRYLPDAVASALSQTEPAAEVIVVDDGSADGSADLVATMPGIVPVVKPNGGQGSALNAGFARATGELILFLDADDMLLPGAVAALAGARDHRAARFQFALETVDAFGRPLGRYAGGPAWPAFGWLAGAVAAEGIVPFMPTSGNAFPRGVLDRLMPLPEADWRLCADLYLVLGAAFLGETADLGRVLGRYRVHGANGHYGTLGAGLHLADRRLAQRRAAWTSLAARLCAIRGQGPLTGRLARGLTRLIAGRAEAAADAPAHPADLILAAGPSRWPCLGAGARLSAGALGRGDTPLGRGFAAGTAEPGRIAAAASVIAFRLPDMAEDWRLSLDFTAEGPVAGVEVRLNGTRIAAADLDFAGTFDLILPRSLLTPWREVAGEPGGLAALIGIAVGPQAAGRLVVTGLSVGLVAATPVPCPMIAEGSYLRIQGGAMTERLLGTGWDWPGAGGARLCGAVATMRLSLPDPGRAAALTLAFDPPPQTPPDALFLAEINGRLVEAFASPDRTTLGLALPDDIAGPDGRIDLRLVPGPEAARAPPGLSLAAVRIDHDRPVPPGLVRLLPGLPVAGAALSALSDGLLPEGGAARVLGPARIGLSLPHGPARRLHLALGPRSADFALALDGRSVRVRAAGGEVVTLDPGEDARSELAVGPGQAAGTPVIDTLRLTAAVPATPADLAAEGDLGPRTLLGLAEDQAAWRLAEAEEPPGALWLAVDRASLVLPPMRGGLELRVLTLPDQRLTFVVGGTTATTTGDGAETLRLTLPGGLTGGLTRGLTRGQTGPLRLTVTTGHLISAALLGAGGGGFLGGALLSVRAVADGAGAVRLRAAE